MNKSNKVFFLIFCIFLMSQLVSAGSGGSLSVVSENPEILTYGSNAQLLFTTYNSSGSSVANLGMTCLITLVNQSNGAILEYKNLSSVGSYGWKHPLNMTLLSTGKYFYTTSCSNSNLAGYLQDEFILTTTGENIQWPQAVLTIAIILLPLIFGYLLLYYFISLGPDHSVLKIFGAIASLGSIFLSLWWGIVSVIKFFDWPEMLNALGLSVWIYGILFFVLFVYFFLYLFHAAVESAKDQKMKKLEF